MGTTHTYSPSLSFSPLGLAALGTARGNGVVVGEKRAEPGLGGRDQGPVRGAGPALSLDVGGAGGGCEGRGQR